MPSSDDPTQANRRLGLFLFFIYLVCYLGFVLLSSFFADSMERPVLAGLNLAIVYGAGLIISALVLSLLYGVLCKSDLNDGASTEEDS